MTNGRRLFVAGDERSPLARRYRDVLAQLISDLGGDPSEAQSLICRRAATLAMWCEAAESDMADGKPIDIGEFTTATNALRRLLADIGLERKARDIGGMTLRERLLRDRPASPANLPAQTIEATAA